MYAEIVLPLPLNRSFHYLVPDTIVDKIKPGMRVQVPFGKKDSIGFIVNLTEESPVFNTKSIISIVDPEPAITKELFLLAQWISEYYMCSLGEALATIIPANLQPPKRIVKKETQSLQETKTAYRRHILTQGQQNVINVILESIKSSIFNVFLLHGVTSSGKTEVYLSCIERILQENRSVIFLLPEISLTPQFINIVKKRFPGIVGVWHSQLSGSERFKTWDGARNGVIKIILGARSAVFAPFSNLGLIIIDEEHEQTYKQEQKPAYHTKDVAIKRAEINNAVVVLGSATPSLETYFQALKGNYRLLELPERIDSRILPPVKIVEAKNVTKKSKIMTEALMDALTKTLARREQAIMFLNRRGFSPSVMCYKCGNVWQCPNCAISLVYHRDPEKLRCHYCGYAQDWPGVCPTCKSSDISIFGVGTQKVEQEIKKLFPQGRIFRLDKDTASKKGVYEKAYEEFRNENFDILLGTQMVAKGFDFPRVTLVGVINADTALYLPDFRAGERTFQLITQVAGRSGRSHLGGEVIVQSRHPEHYSLISAQKHDYKGFYNQEIEFRRQMNYPPFCNLANILLRGRKEESVADYASKISEALQEWKRTNNSNIDILGPTQAAHSKIRKLFRWQILIKGTINDILPVLKHIKKYPVRGGIILTIDVDPQMTL